MTSLDPSKNQLNCKRKILKWSQYVEVQNIWRILLNICDISPDENEERDVWESRICCILDEMETFDCSLICAYLLNWFRRLRRSETEDGESTYKILARHRERQNSVSSVSSDVFPSKDEGKKFVTFIREFKDVHCNVVNYYLHRRRNASLDPSMSQGDILTLQRCCYTLPKQAIKSLKIEHVGLHFRKRIKKIFSVQKYWKILW